MISRFGLPILSLVFFSATMVYGQRPTTFNDMFSTVNWTPVLGVTNRTDFTRPYTTYLASCKDVVFVYPPEYPPLGPNGDRSCILTPTAGKVYRGGLEKYNPSQAQLGLVHKMVGNNLLNVSHVESLPSWADTILLDNLGIETLGNDLQSSSKVTSLFLPNNRIRDIATTQFPSTLNSLSLASNDIKSITTISAPGLKYLDLSDNDIGSLRTTIFPDSLRQLYLFKNANMTISRSTFPPILQTLHLHNSGIVSLNFINWSPKLDDLVLANNRIASLANASFPSALTSLNLANNRIQELRANFPSSLQFLYLGGNPITAFYANQSQYEILEHLRNPMKTSLACTEKEVYPGDCSIFLSTNQTSATCKDHESIKMLWDTFPICIIKDDPIRPFDMEKKFPQCGPGGPGTPCLPGGPCYVCPPGGKPCILCPPGMPCPQGPQGGPGPCKPGFIGLGGQEERSYLPFMLVGVVLITVLLGLGGYYSYRHLKKRRDAKWYNEITTKDKVMDVTEQCDLVNDIRHDPMYSVFRIPANHIERGDLLARGGYGMVYVATLHSAGKGPQQVAMKQMLPEKVNDLASIEEFMEEIRVSARLYHPKIVRFIGISWTSLANLSMINEYMDLGDLWSLLEVNRTQRRIDWNVNTSFRVDFSRSWLSTTTASTSTKSHHYVGLDDPSCHFSKFSVLLDVAQALQYLHTAEINIIHRDVKAKNVLLHGSGVAKLTDFGTSRETIDDQTMTAEIGTVPWIAPEVLMGVRYSEKADIYSFGVLMSEVDLSIVPYSDLKMVVPTAGVSVAMAKARISMMVVSGELRPSFSKVCPQAIIEIAQRCLAFNPDDRPSADELVSWLMQFHE